MSFLHYLSNISTLLEISEIRRLNTAMTYDIDKYNEFRLAFFFPARSSRKVHTSI